MLLEHGVALRTVVVGDQHSDLLEAHPGGLAAQDDGNAYEVVVAIQPTVGSVPLGLQQTDALPVA